MDNSIFLVVPPSDSSSSTFASLGGAEHLGVQYIAGYLIKMNYNTIVLNFESDYKVPREAAKHIVSANPLWIGISPTSFSIQWTLEFCEEIKKRSNIVIVAGGHYASHLGNEFFSICNNVDIISIGDGEVVSLHISEYIEGKKQLEEIKNIIINKGELIINNPIEEQYIDIKTLPWPVRPDFIQKTRSARMIMSRGCPFSCDFCTTPNYYKGKFRFRDPNDVVEEMKYLNKLYGVNKFFFADDLFFYGALESVKRVSKLADLIIQDLPNIAFRGECRADVMLDNLDIVKKLYKAGMKYVFVGLESSVSKDLENYNKKISEDEVAKLPKLLNEIGISLVPGFIIFNKYSTINDIQLNLLFLRSNDLIYRITMISRTCLGYPGSEMYKKMQIKNDYDKQRSSTSILYPNFVSEKVRTLSTAMEHIEIMFLPLDSKMLHLKIYEYDEIKIRKKDVSSNKKIEDADSIFNRLQDIYVTTFNDAINIAENEEFEVGYNKIINLYKELYSNAEEIINSFAKILDSLNNI